MSRELTHLSLFSGIGGLDLAAEWAGFRTVGQCEWAEYPRAVLEKHWPGIPRWRDVRTLTKESFYEQTGLHTVDAISGGFPCQPFSVAGKQRGKDDDRYLWPEFIRIVHELQPAWVIGENVPGIINLALDQVLADLEEEGYEVQCFLIPACGVDAPHKRYRVIIVAHTKSRREPGKLSCWEETWGSCGSSWRTVKPGMGGMADGLRGAVYEADSDTNGDRLQGRMPEQVLETGFTNCSSREREREPGVRRPSQEPGRSFPVGENWPDEPGVGRVAHGVPNRVDRLKCLGNAVVPQQFFPVFDAIARIERMTDDE